MPSAARIFLAFRPLSRTLALALLALEGAWLAWAAWALRLSPSADYAVVVDMARDMASGERFPVFFYGQAYMGSLEPAASALLCALFGFSPFSVCLGTALVSWLACAAIAFFARRAAGWTAAAASLVLLLPGPWYWIHFSASPRGGYAVAVLLAVLGCGIAATSTLAGSPDGASGGGRVRIAPAAAFGLIGGLALWNNLLAAPALLAAGAVLAGRLRAKVFSPRFWLPLGLALFAGSAPWWIWNAANGWAGLSFAPGLPPTGVRNAVRMLAGPVLREFLGIARSPSVPAVVLPVLLAALGAGVLAGWFSGRRRAVVRLGAIAVLHGAAFAVFWGKTSFGVTASARYLLPLFATSVLFAGPALVSVAAKRKTVSARRISGVLAGALLLGTAAFQAAVTVPALSQLERAFGVAFERTQSDAALFSGPVYADFSLNGFHWMSGRTVVPVSTQCCREPWRLLAMEASDRPGVFQGFCEFPRFLAASGGSARRTGGSRVSILSDLTPPPPAAERTDPSAPVLAGADGTDLSAPLLDSDLATAVLPAAAADGSFPINVAFPAAVTNCGVTLAFAPDPAVFGVRAEEIRADGSRRPLAQLNRHWGWFWSGPRPWIGGSDERVELRWKPRRVTALRISLLARPGQTPPRPALLRFLEPSDAPPPDLDAVRGALDRISAESGPVRFVADRWLRARLGNETEPAVAIPRLFLAERYERERDRYSRIDPAGNTAIAVPAGQRAETRRLLEETGLDFVETAVGGTVLFHLPGTNPVPPFFRTGVLRFANGRLSLDRPREAAQGTD